MIATCTKCQARYQLEDEKIPARMIKVRCPACQGIFALDGTQAQVEEPPALEISTFEPSANEIPETPETPVAAEVQPDPVFEAPTAPTAPAAPAAAVVDSSPPPAPAAPQSIPEAAPAASAVATLDEPAPSAGSSRRRRCKEEMLARALVSDILVYNRDTRDTGLEEGNLLEALGGEIKKSWELYKEKVTPEVANSTTYFREALNDILADGDQVF